MRGNTVAYNIGRAVVSETGLLFGDKSPFDLKWTKSLREGFKVPKVSEKPPKSPALLKKVSGLAENIEKQ